MQDVIESSIPCCITGSKSARVVSEKDRRGKPLRTVICVDSGLVFTDPRPTAEEVARFYSDDYRKDYKNTTVPKSKHIVRAGRLAVERLRRMRDFLKPGDRIFDVGAGGGEFVYLCGRAGLSAGGIEPNKGYGTFARESYGIDVDLGFFQDLKLEPGSRDCITMFHVLEHLEEPTVAMQQMATFLRPGGHLVIEVPDVNDTGTAPSNRFHLAHLYNFNIHTLAAAGVKAGLGVASCEAGDGVLFAVFEKRSDADTGDVNELLEGSYEETSRILEGHTTVSHYLRAHVPVGRLVRKIQKNRNEKKFAGTCDSPRAMLDTIFSQAGEPLAAVAKAA